VRAWFSRRFNRHTPHPLVVHAKDYFLSTGKHRDPAELDNYQSDIWTPERLVNVAHALTSLYHQPKKHRLSPDGKRGGEIINDRVFHQDVQSELDLHAIQNEPHLEANEAWKSIALYPLASDTIGPFSHLRKALKTLNTNERETLKTYYSDGKTDAQAAKQFGVSTSAFNKRRERVQNKLAHEFRILRFPRRDNLALIDLSALSGKEWRNLLYGHQESTHPLEFRRDDLSYFTNATSLVSGRNPKPFFENPADPWNTKQSPHYKQPANTEPRPERPAAIRFISLANGIFHDGPHEFLTITEWHDLGKTIYSPAIVSNCVDRLAEMHPKKRGKTTGHPAWFYDALKRSFWFSAARLCVDKQEIRLANLRGNHYQQNRTEAGDADIAALLGISEQKAATLRGRVARRWLGRFRKPSARLPSGTRIDAAHSGVTAPKGLNGRRGRKAVDAGR